MKLAALSLALACLAASSVAAEEVKVYAAAVVRAPLLEMAKEFEAKTGHTIVAVFDTAGSTNKRFHADPGAAILITSQALIGDGEKSGALKGGTSYRLGATVAAIAAPPGAPKPDISTPEKLKAALLAARRIGFSDPARGATVGTHFMKVIDALGIRDEVLKKATLAEDGLQTMRLVVDGKVDLGVTQTSEVVQADPAALVGTFPGEFELATTFSLWHRANAPAAAREFVALITGPAGRAKLAAEGLRPAER